MRKHRFRQSIFRAMLRSQLRSDKQPPDVEAAIRRIVADDDAFDLAFQRVRERNERFTGRDWDDDGDFDTTSGGAIEGFVAWLKEHWDEVVAVLLEILKLLPWIIA